MTPSPADTLARALASEGHAGPGGPFWSAWPWEPIPLILLLAAGVLYAVGWRRLRRAGARVPDWRAWCFLAALLALSAALLSPIAAYSDRLFFMHMLQHLLLLLIAPPLVWLGAPMLPMLWALPRSWRRAVGRRMRPEAWLGTLGRWLAHPATALTAYVVTVAVWHVPRFYDAAQGQTITHYLQHVCFFGTALLYWWPIIYPAGGRRRLSYGWAIPYLMPPLLEGILIGALITFAGRPLYTTYADMEPVWGLSTLDDQTLGGLIMWVPGGMLFLIPLLGLMVLALRAGEREAR